MTWQKRFVNPLFGGDASPSKSSTQEDGAAAPLPRSTRRRTSNLRVLLIDDDEVFCHAMERAGSQQSVEMRSFHSVDGLTGQGLQGMEHYDIALVDLNLGAVNGLELIEYLAEQEILPQVFLISADFEKPKEGGELMPFPTLPKNLGVQKIVAAAVRAAGS